MTETTEPEEWTGPWVTGWVDCPLCGKRWVVVRPICCTELECAGCGEMIEDPRGQEMIDADDTF